MLDTSSLTALAKLPAVHPILAQWHRTSGLLALQQGSVTEGRKSLEKALQIYETLYGRKHWRAIRARQELQLASR
jgi:hypothetical protein